MGYVYLIESSEGKRYVGSTPDVSRRLKQHNKLNDGRSRYTKSASGWQLIYFKGFATIEEARRYERKVKASRFARDQFYREAGVICR